MSDMKEEIGRLVAMVAGKARPLPELQALPLDKAHAQVAELRKAARLAEPTLEERMTRRGVPGRFTMAICGGLARETAASTLAFRLIGNDGCLLILAGPVGCGKSFAAAWALSRLSGLFVTSPALAVIDDTGALDARMRTCSLLVVDDLGVEHSPSGWAVARLDAIVTHRWDARKRTLLTTNLNADQFAKRYGPRLASRANGDPLGWRDLAGPDLRADAD